MTPEVERAREQSRVFLLAARRCNEFQPLPSGYLQFLFVPSLVLYAFAIEVGFKTPRPRSWEGPRGHDLVLRQRDLVPRDVDASSRSEEVRQVTSR